MSKLKQPRQSRNRPSRTIEFPTEESSTSAPPEKSINRILRYLMWLYLLLLLFDGALRKWFLPGMSDVILVSRIPVILMIYLLALPARAFVVNGYVITAAILAFLSMALAIPTHGSMPVAIYGMLVNYFSIPLIFIIPHILGYEESERMGRVLLYFTIPMTVLIAMQFYAPQSAWINRSVGGIEGTGFTGALGRYRPPGTFSFISGVAQFYTLAFAFFLAEYVNRRTLPQWFLLPTGAAFIMAAYGSISRLLALSMVLVFVMCVIGLIVNGRKLHNTFKVLMAVLVFFAIASRFTYFNDGMETFMARWENAKGESTATNVVVDRTLGDMLNPIFNPQYESLIGSGLGIGTNVGAKLMVGQRQFLAGENEWGRVMVELGPVLGYSYILLRVAIVLLLAKVAFRALTRGNLLPWLIFASGFMIIISGQWGQQTTLGFAIFTAGLVLSTAQRPPELLTSTASESKP